MPALPAADSNRDAIARLTTEVSRLRQVVPTADATPAAVANDVARARQRVTARREPWGHSGRPVET